MAAGKSGGAGAGGGKGKGSAGYSGEQAATAKAMAEAMAKMQASSSVLESSFATQADSLAKLSQSMKEFASETTVSNLTKIGDAFKLIADAINSIDSSKLAALSSVSASAQSSITQLSAQVEELSKKINAVPTRGLTSTTTQLGNSAGKTSKQFGQLQGSISGKLATSAGVLGGAFDGILQGFKNIFSLGSGVTGVLGSIAGGMFEIGKSILAIPFKMFSGLIDMAGAGGGISEYAQAINNIRKEFGSLKGPMATTIQEGAKSMKGFSDTGLSATAVFGNIAERMEKLTQLAVAAGPAFHNLRNTMDVGHLLGYQRGLGISDEAMGDLALRAQSSGQPLDKMFQNMTKQALGLGKAFDIDSKIISKGMTKAMQNMKAFGNVSEKAIGQAVVYAHKLGIDLDKVSSSLDSFATFDQAADNVSKLNEAFGTNIDAMDLLNAETPAEQMEILRKAMKDAGVQGEKLTRAQRALIQQATGWDDATSMAALSTKNYGVSLGDIKKKSEDVSKKELTNAQAMSKLADAMERTLKAGEAMQGGFFQQFIRGFGDGIKQTKEFREVMMAIRQSLVVVYNAGRQLGRMFVQMFPGVKDILGGLKDGFSPKKFKKLMSDVLGVFKDFFKDLSGPDGKASFPKLMNNLKEKFFDFFNSQSGAGSKLLDGFSKFGKALVNIFAGMITWVSAEFTKLIRMVIDFIKNPEMPKVSGSMGFLQPVLEALSEAWPPLWAAVKDLFSLLFEKLMNWVKTDGLALLKEFGPYLAAIMFGPAMVRSLIGGLTGALGSAIGKAFTGGGADKQLTSVLNRLNQTMSRAPQGAPPPAPVPNMSQEQIKTLKNMEIKVAWSKVLQFLVGFTGVVAVGLLGFLGALALVKGEDPKDVLAAIGIMVSIGIVAKLMGPVFQQIQRSPKPDIKKIGMFLLAMGGALAVGMTAVWGMLELVQEYKFGAEDIGRMLGLTVILGAVMTVGAGIAFMATMLGKMGTGAFKDVLIGMGLIALAVGGMLLTAWGILELLDSYSNIKGPELEGMGILLDAIADAFMKSGVILLEAAGIGAAVVSSGGIIAGAMAVGFPLMAMAVAEMVKIAGDVMVSLNSMQGDPAALKMKAEAFVAIMMGVVDMMKSMGEILEIISDMTSWFDTPEENQATIKSMTDFANSILGTGGKEGGGIQGVIQTLIDGMATIPADKVNTMQAFGSILSAVGMLVQTVGKGMSEFQDSTESTWEALFGQDPEELKKKMGVGQNYMSTMLTSIGTMVTTIVGAFKGIPMEDAASIEKMGPALGGILQSFTGLMKAVVPNPSSFVQETESAVEGSYAFGMASAKGANKIKTLNTGAMKMMLSHIGKMIKLMAKFLPEIVGGILSAVTSNVNQLTPQTAKFIEPLGKVLDTVIKLVVAIMPKPDSPKPPDPSKVKKGATVVYKITQTFPDLGKMLQSLSKSLPSVIDTIVNAAMGLSKYRGKGIEANITLLTKILDVLPKFTEIAKAVGEATKKDDGGSIDKNAGFKMAESFRQIKYFLQYLFYGGKYDDGSVYDAQLTKIIEIFQDKYVSDLMVKAGTVMPSVNKMVSMVDALSKLTESTKKISGSFPDGPADESAGLKMANTFRLVKYFLQYLFTGKAEGSNYSGSYDAQLVEIIKIFENADVQANLNKQNVITGNVPKLTKMFDALGQLVTATNNLASQLPAAKGSTDSGAVLASSLQQIKNFVSSSLSKGGSLETIVNKISDASGTIEKSKTLTGSLNTLKGFIPTLGESINSIKTSLATFATTGARGSRSPLDAGPLFAQVGKFSSSIMSNSELLSTDIGPTVAQVEKVTLKAFTKAAKLVDALVDAGMRLSDSLSKGSKIDLGTKLKMYTSNYGKFLGAGGNYTVTTKDVNININFKIAIDGEQVERMTLSSGNSVIRQRVNLLLEAIKDNKNEISKVGAKAAAKDEKPATDGSPSASSGAKDKAEAAKPTRPDVVVSANDIESAFISDKGAASMPAYANPSGSGDKK